MSKHDSARRDFVRKAAYVAPVVLSLSAFSSLAKAGSQNGDGPTTVEPAKSAKDLRQEERRRRQEERKQARCEKQNEQRVSRGKDPKDC